METFSTRQLAVIAAANKTIYWIFRVQDTSGNIYYWSTGTQASSGNETVTIGALEAPGVYTDNEWEREHTFGITNFSGITLRRSKSESGIHAPNDVSFTIINPENMFDATYFTGGTVRIGLVIADATGKELCGSWRFRIKSASPYGQQIDVTCEDFLQEYLKGSYPNTRLLSDIFPNVLGTVSDNLCVPEPYGTCYIPLRSVYAVDARYYLLGETTNTYTITAVRSPREVGTKIEWVSPFVFTQATKADAAAKDWRVFQPIIADSNNDGTVDASGLWMSGSKILDMPTKFSRSDTASVTSPADIIRYVLRNMGLSDTDLNLTSFDAAKATFTGWSLAWNFAFWYKEARPAVLARLLAMCHSCLIVGEQVSLQVLSAVSQKTITEVEVMKMQEVGPDTFRYSDTLAERTSDSGYVAFQKSGESQDEFIKILVPAKATKAVIDSEVITFPGVSDTQQVQKLGTLYYQRKFLKSADVSFVAKGTCLALRPDDVITINYDDFGGPYAVLIDEVTINPDVSVNLACVKFSAALDEWAGLSPGAITIITEGAITTVYSPVVAGPDGTGTSYPNLVPGRLRVGSGANFILLDPAGDGKIEMGYTAPGDNNTTPGAGFKVTGGKVEAYGSSHALGGNLVSSDGHYMACIGKRLTDTGKQKRYPLHNTTNFSEDGAIRLYKWIINIWSEVVILGGGIESFAALSQTSRLWVNMAAAPDGDIYACVSNGDIYKQTNGAGDFAALSQTSRAWSGMAAAPDGDIYASDYGGDIYKQTNGTGDFVALSQTSRNWYGMAAAPDGDVYACVDGGDIYKQTNGAGDFAALSQTSRAWRSMAAAPNGDVYACVAYGDIYKQTNGAGDFAALSQTSRQWYGMAAAPNGDIYACVLSGDIYMQNGGTGNFIALSQTSRNWYGMAAAPDGGIYAASYGGDIYKQMGLNDSAIVVVPSSSASAPTHRAIKGTFWNTSACVLYVNKDGGTTWEKVGAQ